MGLLQDFYKVVTRPYQQATGWAEDAVKGVFGDYSNNKSDRERYNQQLAGQIPQMRAGLPNLSNMFQQYQSNVMGSVKPPTDLSNYYGQARANLSQNMGNQVADASSQAGALAASRGMANPSAFVANQAQNVRQSFVPQFGALEAEQALRTAQQQDEFNRYYTQLLAQLGQGQIGAAQGDLSNQLNLFNIEAGLAGNYDPYSTQDKYLNMIPAFAQLAGAL